MTPEIGHFALILSFAIAVIGGVLPVLGAHRNDTAWIALAKPCSRLIAALVSISFACLTLSFINNDFSVVYVAQHSNTLLPTAFRIAAVWGGHEGSLLLWVLMLVGWMAG